MIIAHGTFNGTMRMSQGGKFEHGFLSGFVSSLGGSYLQSQSPNMSVAGQAAMSAAIGGTAEALGGGKFANGAVRGAYVMMFNHLGGEPKPIAHDKEIAISLRNQKFIGGIPNPFYDSEAIFGDLGFLITGMEIDEGLVYILAGDNVGDLYRYSDLMCGVTTDFTFFGLELGRFDLKVLQPEAFLVEQFSGQYTKFSAGGNLINIGVPLGFSGAYMISYPYNYKGISIHGFAIQFSLGFSILGPFSGRIQWGDMSIR